MNRFSNQGFFGPDRAQLRERIEQLEEELEDAREGRATAVARAEDLEEQLYGVLSALAEGSWEKEGEQ